MFGDKILTSKDAEEVVKVTANMFRHDPYFVRLANCSDAYDYYVANYLDSFKTILDQKLSKRNKDAYLICINMNRLKEESPKMFEEIFGSVPAFVEWTGREKKPVCYLLAVFKSNNPGVTNDVMRMLKEFIKDNKDKAIYADGFVPADYDILTKETGCKLVKINSLPYLTWR